MNAAAVESLHRAFCVDRIVVFNKTVVETFALELRFGSLSFARLRIRLKHHGEQKLFI